MQARAFKFDVLLLLAAGPTAAFASGGRCRWTKCVLSRSKARCNSLYRQRGHWDVNMIDATHALLLGKPTAKPI